MLLRFTCALAVMLGVEAAAFAAYNRDLLFLRAPVEELARAPIDTVRAHAVSALERESVPRRHLDAIARVAQLRGLDDLELNALNRLHERYPEDAEITLLLADALRRSARYSEAESLYQQLLAPLPSRGGQ
jgi:hypothetical protein